MILQLKQYHHIISCKAPGTVSLKFVADREAEQLQFFEMGGNQSLMSCLPFCFLPHLTQE